ncbi:hypothetical protein LCGC14_1625620 [marine sediment metagenome]|uniref:Uncharacterized protein n=1 Tax=marine sediment metagenome TaxID=412755 RepID=A0A0F9IR48_9ZZZZ
MKNIASTISRAWNHMIPSGKFISRFTGRHIYCYTCRRTHTGGCHPWRS